MMYDVDAVAGLLAYGGRMARRQPPAWDGGGISAVMLTPDGVPLGRVLPGRGIALLRDLQELGITRPIPYVYERSPLARATERARGALETVIRNAGLPGLPAPFFGALRLLSPEQVAVRAYDLLCFNRAAALRSAGAQAAITTYNGIIAGRAGGKAFDFGASKSSITTVASAWSTLWRAGGLPAAGGFTASPGTAPTRATTGALNFGLPDPGGSDKAYLLTFGYASGSALNWLILGDLLVETGSYTIDNTQKTVSTTALTRYTGGGGVFIVPVVTTALGATAGSLNINSYTDQDGNTGAATGSIAMTNSAIVERIATGATTGPFTTLATGDYGVRAISTLTSSGNTGGGAVGIMLLRPLAYIPGLAGNYYIERDSTTQVDGLTELELTAGGATGCLTVLVLANTTSTGVANFFLRSVQG